MPHLVNGNLGEVVVPWVVDKVDFPKCSPSIDVRRILKMSTRLEWLISHNKTYVLIRYESLGWNFWPWEERSQLGRYTTPKLCK